MDGLVFTPKRTDFLKDGGIFAQSPASTPNASKPRLTRAEPAHRTEMEHAAVAKPQVTQLRVPQPHSDSLAQAIWAPRPSNVPQAAALGPDDIARQIRAKFENLVRASPLPKVVEQMVSPATFAHRPDWSVGRNRDMSKPPMWQARQLPANQQNIPSDVASARGVHALPDHADLSTAADAQPPHCQVSLEARLGDQPLPNAQHNVTTSHVQLVESRAAGCEASPVSQQVPADVYAAQTGPPCVADIASMKTPALSIAWEAEQSVQAAHTAAEQSKSEQQQQQALSAQTAAVHSAEPAVDAGQEAAGPADDEMLRQESSSLMSLSPSLKLNIPGLDDMLDSQMLSANEEHATSPMSVHVSQQRQQQQHCFGGHQQHSFGDQQQQQEPKALPGRAPASDADRQLASVLSAGYPSPQHLSPGLLAAGQALQVPSPAAAAETSHEASHGGPVQASPCQQRFDQLAPGPEKPAGTAYMSGTAPADAAPHASSAASQQQEQSRSGSGTGLLHHDNCPAGALPGSSVDAQQSGSSKALNMASAPVITECEPASGNTGQVSVTVDGQQPRSSAPDLLSLADSNADTSQKFAPDAAQVPSSQAEHGKQGGSMGEETAMLQASSDAPAVPQPAQGGAAETLPDAPRLPTQIDGASNAGADEAAGSASGQGGPEAMQQTSATASKKGVQQKHRQPSSSTATGPAPKRRCMATRSSQGGQVQPLLTAPNDVSWQDKKGLYETSRSGRIRYPPLAFWMRETKVHDKLGGAVAIERPAASPTPPAPAHPKPPLPNQFAAPALARNHSRSLPPQPQLSLQSQDKSHAQPRSVQSAQTEAQSESQPQAQASMPASEEPNEPAASSRPQQHLPVQHSRRHRGAASLQPAVTVPQDPPSPPFPYPILAGKAPKAHGPAGGSSEQQTGEALGLPGKKQAQKQTAAKLIAVPGKAVAHKDKARGSVLTAAADGAAEAVGNSSNSQPATTVDDDLSCKGQADAVAIASAAGVSNGKLRRCGTCKTCMQRQLKKGCLVLKALKEQIQSVSDVTTPASQAKQPQAAEHSKPAAVDKLKKGSHLCSGSMSAKQHKAEQAEKADTDSKSAKAAKSQKAITASKPDKKGKGKGKKSTGTDKGSKASSAQAQGSIHSALTQAVELASDMEEPGADEQQQEAAQALDSLKNSPVAPSASQPAVPGSSAAGPGPSASGPESGPVQAIQPEEDLMSSPDVSPSKRGRGRPRKNQVFFGPKRAKGRPRKSSVLPASPPEPAEAPSAEGSGSQPEGSSQQAQLPSHEAGPDVPSGSAAPVKVKLEKPVSSKGKQAKGSQPKSAHRLGHSDIGSTPAASEQPSTSGRTSVEATAQGWTAEQKAALQRAYLTVKPSQCNFWQHVAKLVPGKTALQCCNCKFDELPTPVEKGKQTSKHAPSRDSSPVRPPPLKVAGGRIKKPSAAATKQWARQVRWQQRAQAQSDSDSPQPAAQTSSHQRQSSNLGSAQRGSATATLLAAIHKQDKADKYIDRILRKQGGRLHKVKAMPAPSASLQVGKVNQRSSQHTTTGLMAELQALGRQQQPMDEDMYESEQDHYFSEDD